MELLFDDNYFMKQALIEAQKAFEVNEVPVGAVITIENKIIAKIGDKIITNFDIRNEINVWNDTGRATYTLSANDVSLTNPERIGNLNEHLLKPEWYSEPRKIDIGLKISF